MADLKARPVRREVLAMRNPLLLLRSAGAFLLRLAERALIALLFQEPPRRTRAFGREPAERVVSEETHP